MEELYDILPKKGEWVRFLGNRHTLSFDKLYQVIDNDYQINCYFTICVEDDLGFHAWLPLVEFNIIDE